MFLTHVTFTCLLGLACLSSAHSTTLKTSTTTKTVTTIKTSTTTTTTATTVTTKSTTQTSSTPACATFTDTFDNYTSAPGLEEAIPVAFDGGLFYNGAAAVQPFVDGTGIILPSPPYAAGIAVLNTLLQIGVVTLNPFATLSTAGTSTKSFSLLDFYFGCTETVDNGLATSTPVGCGIEVYGYDIWGEQVGTAAFNFAPLTPIAAQSRRAVLPAYFTNLQNVTFAIALSDTTTATTVVYIDNVRHVNC